GRRRKEVGPKSRRSDAKLFAFFSMADAKVLQQDWVFNGKLIRVRVDRIIEPAGHESVREIVVSHNAVCVVARPTPDQVILIRQYRHATGGELLEIPAGGLHDDETPEAGAIRELEEETGFRAGRMIAHGGFWMTPGFTTEYMHVFEACDLTKTKI